jgi:hypothetical protein
LLAGAAIPTAAYGQCVTDRFTVDACRGGVRGSSGPPGQTLDLNFMFPGTLDPRITFTRASTATYTDASGVIQTAAIDQPRWDYAGGVLRGLLIEEARTNLLLNSTPITGWAPTNVTLVPASGIAPDGTNTMVRVAEDGTNTFHLNIAPLLTIVAATVSTFSVFVKMQQTRYLQLVIDDNASSGVHANFDLQTGSVTLPATIGGSASGAAAQIQALGNGFYRCSIACATNSSTTGRFILGLINTPTTPKFGGYQGNPANGLLAWGAQVEQGMFGPTSLIPTTSVAVTRSQDICGISAANMVPWFASPGGTWFVEFINTVNTVSFIANGGRLIGEVNVPGGRTPLLDTGDTGIGTYDGVAFFSTGAAITAGSIVKGASAWTTGRASLCANGGTVAASAAQTQGFGVFATNGLRFLQVVTGASAENANGYLRRATYWPRALSDAEMKQVTA